MLRIRWIYHTPNIEVLQKMCVKAGHIMINTSGHCDTLLSTIEGRLGGTRRRGRPRQTWVDDLETLQSDKDSS